MREGRTWRIPRLGGEDCAVYQEQEETNPTSPQEVEAEASQQPAEGLLQYGPVRRVCTKQTDRDHRLITCEEQENCIMHHFRRKCDKYACFLLSWGFWSRPLESFLLLLAAFV